MLKLHWQLVGYLRRDWNDAWPKGTRVDIDAVRVTPSLEGVDDRRLQLRVTSPRGLQGWWAASWFTFKEVAR